jgi:hypothetical protein
MTQGNLKGFFVKKLSSIWEEIAGLACSKSGVNNENICVKGGRVTIAKLIPK